MTSATAPIQPPPSTDDAAAGLLAWARREPLGAALVVLLAGVLIYFFGFYSIFMNGSQSTARWAYMGWNEENDQEHCRFLLPIIGFILWYHREDLRAAVKAPSARGLAFVLGGMAVFVVGVRCLQPRLALLSLPLLTYGIAEYLGGRAVARIFIFPCLLMLFMVPIGGVIQGTVTLQLLASKVVGVICGLLGVRVEIVGTNIIVDGHHFEVAGGCSGIRSLMAMTLLAALYVHFVLRETWQQLTVFVGSIFFALVGNIARLLTVALVAKWWDPAIAGGLYHEYSGFVFFPFAVLAMVAFGNLVSRDWSSTGSQIAKKLTTPDSAPPPEGEAEAGVRKPASPISYDY
jgi:exosortase